MSYMPKIPHARPVEEMPARITIELRQRGLWRCAVIVPACIGTPVAEIGVMMPDGKPLYRCFCKHHAREFCKRLGIEEPDYPIHGIN
jgi:hypothetical protein